MNNEYFYRAGVRYPLLTARRRILFIVFGLLLAATVSLQAQHKVNERQRHHRDTTGLNRLFTLGHFHANARNDLMTTINKGELTDYFAWALGAGIGFETSEWKGLQFGVSGFFIYRLPGTSDLTRRDSLTNQFSRYEVGLFDMEDYANGSDLDRLEELFLRYRYKKSTMTLGKQILNTPFVNKQDGRMRPTLEEGVWLQLNEIPKLKIEAGWIYKISPRSTVNWYGIGESVGIYPVGLDVQGNPSGYKGNVHSKGIGLLHVSYAPVKQLTLTAWENFAQNMFNTLLLQAETDIALNANTRWKSGIQYTTQQAVNNGGNDNAALTFFPKNNRSQIISARSGISYKNLSISAAYTRITDEGRFLFPREWGREPFYTFLQRERMEGLGNVHAANITVQKKLKSGLGMSFAYGHYYTPDVMNVALNKYGLPSFRQFNAQLSYPLGGFMHGTTIDFLYVYKGNMGNTYDKARYLFNKTDMHHLNLIMNYRFNQNSKH